MKVLAEKELNQEKTGKNINFWFYHKPESLSMAESKLECDLKSTKNEKNKKIKFDYLIESLGYDMSPIDPDVTVTDYSTGRAKLEDRNIYLAGWALSGAKGVVGDSTETARTAVERNNDS